MTRQPQSPAIATLRREHALISRVISVMEGQAASIEAGNMPRAGLIELISGFFASFTERRHHGKEERFLFPAIAGKKAMLRDGPVKTLTAEHESSRHFVSELRAGVTQLNKGDFAGASRIGKALTLYARMLRKHIAREEDIVFLLTEVLLSDAELTKLAEDFDNLDEATQDSNLAKASDLVLRIEELNRAPESRPTRSPAAS